ncbi:MAG: FAD-dependent thymidylate synthase [Candidatus Firestonebacteria bacterium]|nr:FAD-dependent thymidylate synthase [Candidatus Firestonebacteria bacterium]
MEIKVILLQHTQEPERVVAQAAKLCYSAVGLEAIAEKLTPEKTAGFIQTLAQMGHLSAFEHAGFTFGIEGVSRALTHQLVRHRLASFSQQSQRYVTLREFPYITPPSLAQKPELKKRFDETLNSLGQAYGELLAAGIPAEDARYLLPNACETKIVVSMNARELLHFFALRCCNRAQWEIHALADEMLRVVKPVAPALFAQAGPGCVSGACPEGKMSCGNMAEVREKYAR